MTEEQAKAIEIATRQQTESPDFVLILVTSTRKNLRIPIELWRTVASDTLLRKYCWIFLHALPNGVTTNGCVEPWSAQGAVMRATSSE